MPDAINPAIDHPIYLFTFFCGYLLGSIPFGLILTKLAGLGDVRKIGSGNIGATNVLRTGNKGLALATLLLDAGKGLAAALLGKMYGLDIAVLASLGAFVGHLFPVWLKFRGGKGVATFFGVLFGLAWPTALMALGTWLLVAALSRYSSLAALVTAFLAPFYSWVMKDYQLAELYVILGILIFVRHQENIRRLWAGTETKITGTKTQDNKTS